MPQPLLRESRKLLVILHGGGRGRQGFAGGVPRETLGKSVTKRNNKNKGIVLDYRCFYNKGFFRFQGIGFLRQPTVLFYWTSLRLASLGSFRPLVGVKCCFAVALSLWGVIRCFAVALWGRNSLLCGRSVLEGVIRRHVVALSLERAAKRCHSHAREASLL